MPSRTLLVALGAVTLMVAVGVAEPRLIALAAVLDVLLLAAFAVDLVRARRTIVVAERVLPDLLVQGAPVQVETRVTAARAATIRLRETLHPALAEAPLRVEATGTAVAWTYRLVPRRRGTHTQGPLTARVQGPWGLAWSQRELLPPEPRRVYPQVRWDGAVGQLLLLAQRRQLGQSPMRVRGLGSEPYALREYRPGDPLSRVHWKASARHDHLVTREDAWERGSRLVVLLDCARTMLASDHGRSKLDHALAAALALLRVASSRGDRVTVIAFSDRVERVVRVRPGTRGVSAAYGALFDLEARQAEPAYDVAAETVSKTETRRATVVLLTSVVDLGAAELLREALVTLRGRHRTVLVNLEDPELARLAWGSPRDVREAFAKTASLEILLGNKRLGTHLRHHGIRVASVPADRLAWEVLQSYLGTERVRA